MWIGCFHRCRLAVPYAGHWNLHAAVPLLAPGYIPIYILSPPCPPVVWVFNALAQNGPNRSCVCCVCVDFHAFRRVAAVVHIDLRLQLLLPVTKRLLLNCSCVHTTAAARLRGCRSLQNATPAASGPLMMTPEGIRYVTLHQSSNKSQHAPAPEEAGRRRAAPAPLSRAAGRLQYAAQTRSNGWPWPHCWVGGVG
jgi:hypothetical protein